MRTLPTPISDAERAVHHYKLELLKRVMAHILRRALLNPYVSACDVPEDLIEKEHRQGVASNAWNALAALEIIERLPLNFTDESRKIYGGRMMNTNPDAKGRWVAVYRLRSRSAAVTWANANNVRLADAELQPESASAVQVEINLG